MLTVSGGEFSRGSSRTQQITLKSKSVNITIPSSLTGYLRVRLGTTRSKGDRICPRCTILTATFDKLGHQHDTAERATKARHYPQMLVHTARAHVYSSGYPVNSVGIERMLKPMSLVPTTVCAAQAPPIHFN